MQTLGIQDLKAGDWVRVLGFRPGQSPVRAKLLALGLLPGAVIQFIRRAPLGDPFEIQIQGCSISLRAQEVGWLEVVRLDGALA